MDVKELRSKEMADYAMRSPLVDPYNQNIALFSIKAHFELVLFS